MSSTLILPGEDIPMTEPAYMLETLQGQVDLVVDGGNCGTDPSTVVDLTHGVPRILRTGLGNVSAFEHEP